MTASRESESFLTHELAGPPTRLDDMTLSEARDEMTRLEPEPGTERALMSIIERWLDDPDRSTPLSDLQQIMEQVREKPRGEERFRLMNTVVRTLGQPDVLATLLDLLRHAAERDGTNEQELSKKSQTGEMHCLYGWCGQTVIMQSLSHPTKATLKPASGIQKPLGYAPATWGLSIHIWQPNPKATPFRSGKRDEPGIIVEPPHSHPFDFLSMVSIGSMHQSVYIHRNADEVDGTSANGDRYGSVLLDHVDGVWPPHTHRSPAGVATVEERVELKAGQSYFMRNNLIHDVEVETKVAVTKPAITLYMSSEAVVIPHAYMAPSMVDYHKQHSDLKENAEALPTKNWHAKLKATAAYLRGESETLNLDEIVDYDGEYAFFHS